MNLDSMLTELKIATHDSATGESSMWYCIPLIPFARTQSKTLVEQYNAGCRLFDIRIKYHRGKWKFAHGIWISKCTVDEIFYKLNNLGGVNVTIVYEGNDSYKDEFINFVRYLKSTYQYINYGYTAIKYGKDSTGLKTQYEFIDHGDISVPAVHGFLPLDGRSWHTYLPIPWLWKVIYNNKPKFSKDHYTYVDFL